jgi:outer membrane immunogenic protein
MSAIAGAAGYLAGSGISGRIDWPGKSAIRKALGVAALTLLGQASAMAADMPVKAPLTPAAQIYDWSGFYVGGNIGYGVARDRGTDTYLFPDGTLFAGEAVTQAPAGAVGGGQIGANWQTGRWVLGLEGDWQGTGQKDSICVQTCSPNVGQLNYGVAISQRIDWLATLRGRLGYADGGFLWYMTAGGAWGSVTSTDIGLAGPLTFPANFSHSPGGWTVGAGVETALGGNWTAKLEYLYVDLGSTTDSFVASNFTNIENVHADVRDNIVRAGLNYRFGGSSAPLASLDVTAPSATSWTGFYVGGNAGYGFGHETGNESFPFSFMGFSGFFSAQSFSLAPAGAAAGLQAGYNWQSGNWVAGLEGDWDWTHQTDSISISGGTPATNINGGGLTIAPTLQWLATLRGRLGYTRDSWLWYVTGGGAWGGLAEADSLSLSPTTVPASFTHALGGWTAGVGVEKDLGGHWSAKLEYLYIDLGQVTDAISITFPPTVTDTINQHVTDHLIRGGVNYRF